jgi:serine/threonine protein kinase
MESNKNSSDENINQEEKQYDTIAFRVDFIENLIKGTKLESLVAPDDSKDILHHHDHNADEECTDIRCILDKKICNFYDIITKIGCNLVYIKSGTTGHTFHVICDKKNGFQHDVALKIVAYPIKEKYGDIYDVKRPENAELLMIRVLSHFVVTRKSPHIALPIGTFNANIDAFVALTKSKIRGRSKFDNFLKSYDNKEFYNRISVLISEWATGGDLLEYIRKNYKSLTLLHWKVIMFQIVSVLAVIQNKYPGFRHNDLKANNILVQLIPMRTKNNFMQYDFKKQYYFLVPNIGIMVKLWDFDFASIPGLVNNAKVESRWARACINVCPKQNRYYDIHYFCNTIRKKAFFPQYRESEYVPQEFRDFINRVVPNKYKKTGEDVGETGRLLADDEYTTPMEIILNDPFFEEFRCTKNVIMDVYKQIKNRHGRNDNEDKETNSKNESNNVTPKSVKRFTLVRKKT